LSEALIAGNINERPAFLEVYLDANQLFYRPVSAATRTSTEEKPAGILLFSN
jgi:ATP-dependent Clp protease ATP-binding subunit ClpC